MTSLRNVAGEQQRGDRNVWKQDQVAATAIEKQEEVALVVTESMCAQMGNLCWHDPGTPLADLEIANWFV